MSGERTALYARISEDPLGLEKGVTRQVDDGRALITSRGWHPAGEFVDNDVSALSGKRRPQYEALMAAVEAGEVDRIVTYMQSRLWRNRDERARAIGLLRKHRVHIAAVRGPELDLSSATGRMLADLMGTFDTHESEVKGERVARAAQQRAEAGQANAGVAYGWRREYDADERGRTTGFRDVVEDAQADVVREVVDRVLGGEGLRRLAADLNERGLPSPKGGVWTHGTVRKLAMRESNVALRITRTTCTSACRSGCNGHVVGPAAWPAIVDEGAHRRVVELLSDPGRQARGLATIAATGAATRRHLLTYGIASCGAPLADKPGEACGSVLRVATKRLRRNVRPTEVNPDGVVVTAHELYVCEQKGCVGRNRQRVDEFVRAVVLGRLSRPDARELLRVPAESTDGLAELEAKRLRGRLDDAAEDYAAGLIDREQMRRITATLRPQVEQAERQSDRPVIPLPVELEQLVNATDAAVVWDATPLVRQRAVLEVLLEVVLLPTRKGAGFDPTTVRIDWRGAA